MNYDVLLNRTGFGRLNITQQIRSVSESEGQYRQQNQELQDEIPTRTNFSQSDRLDLRVSPGSTRSTPFRTGNAVNSSEELKGKVETKLMTMWNNVKFGWGSKMKTSFNKEQPLWLLGRCYHQKITSDPPSMESSMELTGHVTVTNNMDANQYIYGSCMHQPNSSEIYVESPPEETGTDAVIEDSSPEAVIEEEGIEAFKRDFISRIWMTYRKEFQTMDDSNFTSDCGWGCMIRSGQMLLAQGLIMHFLGRGWRWDPSEESLRINFDSMGFEDGVHRKIIRWFGDTSSKCSPFSIHSLVALGREAGKKPGDWYGPGAVAHLLKRAVKHAAKEIADLDGINVYVAQDCAVYIQDIIDECTISVTPCVVPWQKKLISNTNAEPPAISAFTTDSAVSHSVDSTLPSTSIADEFSGCGWKSLILLVPLRLGTEKLNPIYNDCLKAMLSLDSCIGIIGGRPKHSLFFVGYQEDKLIHLDPHYCQDMIDVNQENFPVSSFHCKSPRKMKLSKMDPSCCIGFFCATKKDFFKFVENVKPFLLPVKQQMTSSFTSSSGLHQFNEITYPMFVFCRGKSSEQQIDLPFRTIHRSSPVSQSLPSSTIHSSNTQLNFHQQQEDLDDDDEAIEFVIL